MDEDSAVSVPVCESLTFCIPKRTPKWVTGFPDFLDNVLHIGDPNIKIMKDTWLQYERQYWDTFQARGKPRKKREKKEPATLEGNVIDVPESEKPPPKVHPSVRSALRKIMASFKRIGIRHKDREVDELLELMNNIISC